MWTYRLCGLRLHRSVSQLLSLPWLALFQSAGWPTNTNEWIKADAIIITTVKCCLHLQTHAHVPDVELMLGCPDIPRMSIEDSPSHPFADAGVLPPRTLLQKGQRDTQCSCAMTFRDFPIWVYSTMLCSIDYQKQLYLQGGVWYYTGFTHSERL